MIEPNSELIPLKSAICVTTAWFFIFLSTVGTYSFITMKTNNLVYAEWIQYTVLLL